MASPDGNVSMLVRSPLKYLNILWMVAMKSCKENHCSQRMTQQLSEGLEGPLRG